jgi:diguanylate cyclase (GGDEF)-like protein
MADTEPMDKAPPWWNVLNWNDAEKCILVTATMLAGTIVFAAVTTFADGWPYFPPDVPADFLHSIAGNARWIALAWLGLLVLATLTRKRTASNPALVHATVQAYALSTALFTYLTGPYNAAGWIAFIGGSIIGFLLFDRFMVAIGIVTWLVTLVGITYLAEMEVMPLALFVHGPATVQERPTWWLLRHGVIALALSIFILPLCSYIITSWRAREALLEQLSRTDGLTGLANRRHIMEALQREVRHARRYEHPLSCVLVDLDHFKQINDHYGHVVGDRVLVATADALRQAVRDTDTIGRYGGEEFVMLLPNTDADGARRVAERCRKLIGKVRVDAVSITASFGVASCPGVPVEDDIDLIRSADQALYRAKGDGRDRVAGAA